ncbi:MAG: TonB-dependent receptor, partial [Saprospiraceae bacterium]|nr:TonB-dependent receptor [Saprospiraceae bacterium]
LKGVSTLAYSGSNLGGLILVEPNRILHEPHVHGRASYFFESNGRSNGLNLEMQQYTPALGWKINGTLKKSGDQKTADYFLNNTGRREANTALQLEKVFADKLFTELYFSSFNTTLGILRGSHLGNLTDLEEALVRDEPLFTEDKFSYKLEAPKQEVHHQLLSLGAKYFFREHQWLELKMATQFNSRKEFDVRRSGRSEIPALSLKQLSCFADGKYHHRLRKDLVLNMGSQLNFIDNTNRIETGILPLIPDYLAVESGLFAWINNEGEKSFYEFGVRYDHIHQSVPTISRTTPREIERFTNSFHNLNLAAGGRFDLGGQISLSLNAGFVTRNPAINELYSRGLHQGVGGIEEGNPELLSEKSFKSTIGINGQQGKAFSFESLIYYHRINDFIYLRPSDETRLTIRGAFPVFGYEQTDATIFGFDLLSRLELSPRVDAKVAFSYLRGRDQTLGIPLIFMPPNNLLFNVTYHLVNPVKLGKNQLQNLEVSLESKITFRQGNLLNEQDFKPAPDGYHLMTLKSSTDLHLGKNRIRFFARADNIFNVAYRDYLNRQRYFADDLGFNAAVGATFHF